MKATINRDGSSMCEIGKENYTTFYLKRQGKFKKYYQYDYRHESGALLSTVKESLEACRLERDKFIERVNKIKGIS